jgi:hypothetical protein
MVAELAAQHTQAGTIQDTERTQLVRVCARHTGDADVAEALVQETLTEAWRHADRRPGGSAAGVPLRQYPGDDGLMRQRDASIHDYPIAETARGYRRHEKKVTMLRAHIGLG